MTLGRCTLSILSSRGTPPNDLNPNMKASRNRNKPLVTRSGRYTITLVLTVSYLFLTGLFMSLTVLHLDLTVLCLTLTVLYLALTVLYQYADGGARVAEPERIPGCASRALHHHVAPEKRVFDLQEDVPLAQEPRTGAS